MRQESCLVGFMNRVSKLSLLAAWDRVRSTCSHNKALQFTWAPQMRLPKTLRKHFLMESWLAELRSATTGAARHTAMVVITRGNEPFHMRIAPASRIP